MSVPMTHGVADRDRGRGYSDGHPSPLLPGGRSSPRSLFNTMSSKKYRPEIDGCPLCGASGFRNLESHIRKDCTAREDVLERLSARGGATSTEVSVPLRPADVDKEVTKR